MTVKTPDGKSRRLEKFRVVDGVEYHARYSTELNLYSVCAIFRCEYGELKTAYRDGETQLKAQHKAKSAFTLMMREVKLRLHQPKGKQVDYA